jgi:YbgC/YbaW family acyl-CoA thioester hydrolase
MHAVSNTYFYPVQLDDLDYMGIVSHYTWLTILQRIRDQFLTQHGIHFAQCLAQGEGIVVAASNIKYVRPAKYPQSLQIKVTVHTPFEKGFWIKHHVLNAEGELCVIADLKFVFVNSHGQSITMPTIFQQKFFAEITVSV